jgi:tRNA-modifying protein YgfZ
MSVTVAAPASAYAALTGGAALVDRSERGKLALTGTEAKDFLQGQVTNDVLALEPGRGCYAAFLDHKGKMLGDMRILDAGDELLLDTERVALQELFTMIRRYKLGRDVELHKRTLERGLLSLVGPDAAAVAGTAPGPAEHDHAAAELAGHAVRLVRTDTGLDVYCDAAAAAAVGAELVARGAVAVDEAAAEIVRVERGRPRYGADLDATVIPQEAGLNERAVSFTKGCYVGQETVARLFYRGKPNRQLRGLRLTAPAAPGTEVRIPDGGKVVGRLGTVVTSPRLGPLALALVRREAPPGSAVTVGDDGTRAEVAELPFTE